MHEKCKKREEEKSIEHTNTLGCVVIESVSECGEKELIKCRWESRYGKSPSNKTWHERKILCRPSSFSLSFYIQRKREDTCKSLSVALFRRPHILCTLLSSAVYLFIHLCDFFSHRVPFHLCDTVNIIKWVYVAKKQTWASSIDFGHIEIKWLERWWQRWKIHRPNVFDAADLLSKSVCARALHMSRKRSLFCAFLWLTGRKSDQIARNGKQLTWIKWNEMQKKNQ